MRSFDSIQIHVVVSWIVSSGLEKEGKGDGTGRLGERVNDVSDDGVVRIFVPWVHPLTALFCECFFWIGM